MIIQKRLPQKLTLLFTAAILSLELGIANAQIYPPITKAVETQQIEVLKSGAGLKEKIDACKTLALAGTKDAIPALAALLGDEKLSHVARYALEQINDPAGNAALRDALGTAKGLPLIGVIGSLGNLRDTQAIAPLARFLTGGDADVADAAAHALGRIGTPAAAKPLMASLAKPTTALYDGLLRCAESLPPKEAAPLYDAVRKPGAPSHLRMAGLRGAIIARQDQGVPLIREALMGTDYTLSTAAIQAARDLPGAAVTKALAADLDKLDADRKVLLVQVLGDRRDIAAGPQLLATARKSDGNVRAAAVKAMIQVGDAAAIPFLTEQVASDDADVAKAARTGLVGFAARDAEAPITGMLKSTNPKVRAAAADIIAQRKMTQAIPQLVASASDADPAVATASIRAIGEIGGNADAAALIKILNSGTSIPATENALSALYTRSRDASVSTALSEALPNAPAPSKLALMRVMRRVGGPTALAAVRTAMTDANPEVRENAMRSVSEWPTVDALPDLLAMAKMPPTPVMKVLALRGYLRLIPQNNVAPDQKLASVKEALALVERPEEKRLALTALGGIPTADSLALVLQDLANPALKGEAGLAAVAIGEQLMKTQPTVVTDAMDQVIKSTEDKKLIQRAQALRGKTP